MESYSLSSAVTRLLGPSGPEAGCEECFMRLDEYVERDLARRDATHAMPRVALHLEGCDACREEMVSLHDLVAGSRFHQQHNGS
jgi:hypothetical protein